MSPDLKIATAFVSPLGAKDTAAVIEALNRHARFIRGRMSPALRQMKYMPEFRFKLDTSYDNFARIDELLQSPEVARDLGADDRRRRQGPIWRAAARRRVGRFPAGWCSTSRSAWARPKPSPRSNGCSRPTRPAMPARSIRWPPACCRSRSARRPRPCLTCMDGAKIYRFTVAWGEERSTDDLEGPVTQELRPAPRRSRRPRAAAEIHRRHHADAAAILGHQDRRRARL